MSNEEPIAETISEENEPKGPRYFGGNWGAPFLLNGEEVPVPIGEKCIWCLEDFVDGDQGFFYFNGPATHRECGVRQVVGGVNHQRADGSCECEGGDLDPDPADMSKREAARAAMEYFEKNNVFTKKRMKIVIEDEDGTETELGPDAGALLMAIGEFQSLKESFGITSTRMGRFEGDHGLVEFVKSQGIKPIELQVIKRVINRTARQGLDAGIPPEEVVPGIFIDGILTGCFFKEFMSDLMEQGNILPTDVSGVPITEIARDED